MSVNDMGSCNTKPVFRPFFAIIEMYHDLLVFKSCNQGERAVACWKVLSGRTVERGNNESG